MSNPPKQAAALIAVDWGTSSLRGYLLDAVGTTLDSRATAQGIMQVAAGNFPETLAALTSSWHSREEPLPVLLSGMVGSKQGWREAPYLDTPASVAGLARNLLQVDGQRIWIVPGVKHSAVTATELTHDVMRGEETQIVGAQQDGIFVLPGSHSKWAVVERGGIVRFRTFMTGEVFAALRAHTILARLMQGDLHDAPAFAHGIRRSQTEPGLLANLFSARTAGLFNQIAPEALSSYLSGLLIGAEFAEAMREFGGFAAVKQPLILNGSAHLVERYGEVAAVFAMPTVAASEDSAARGAFLIAQAAGIVAPPV